MIRTRNNNLFDILHGPVDWVRNDPRWEQLLKKCEGDEEKTFNIIVEGESEFICSYARCRFEEFSKKKKKINKQGLLRFKFVRNFLNFIEKK